MLHSRILAAALLGAFALLPYGTVDRVHAQPAAALELLNSERIEQVFGSYGIEVLESDATIRVSNLYSGAGATRVCRTFAVVRYPRDVDPAFAEEHAAILAGGSIGATFTARGWAVVKTQSYLGEIDTTPRLAVLMGGIEAPRLAVHVYVLDIVKDEARFEYAAIAEVHHPDYLDSAAVRELYAGEAQVPGAQDAATRGLLEIVAAKAR